MSVRSAVRSLALASTASLVLLLVAGLVTSPAMADEPTWGDPHSRSEAGVSTIIFPTQDIPLHFSHILHIGKLKANCKDCHENISSSESALDNNLPGEIACRTCHSIDRKDVKRDNGVGKPPGNCAACHQGFDPEQGVTSLRRSTMPIANLKFSHKSHIARKNPCSTCHGDFLLDKVTKATREQLPKMKVCLGCHDGETAPSRCTTCHLSASGGVVQTDFAEAGMLRPSGVLRGAGHTMNFRDSHKFAAQNESAQCASCHKKDFCVDCHNGVTKPMDFHIGDYVAMHAIDARRNRSDCSSCHRLQTFCQGCHSRVGIAGDGKSPNLLDGIRFHPPGFASSAGVGGVGRNHHSYQAQRNIKECASCHRESFCTKCHSNQVGSPRVSPHSRAWRGSRRCQALLKRSKRMCLRCHTETAPLSCF